MMKELLLEHGLFTLQQWIRSSDRNDINWWHAFSSAAALAYPYIRAEDPEIGTLFALLAYALPRNLGVDQNEATRYVLQTNSAGAVLKLAEQLLPPDLCEAMSDTMFRRLRDGRKFLRWSDNQPAHARWHGDVLLADEGKTFLDISGDAAETLTLPPSCTAISKRAFYGFGKSVRELVLPAGLEDGLPSVLQDCPNLQRIQVSTDGIGIFFNSRDGVLFSGDWKTLLFYPRKKPEDAYAIPASVRKIESEAFACADYLRHITFPEGPETIESFAFWNCALRKVTLPASLRLVKDWAFGSCNHLQEVTFLGSDTLIEDYAFDLESTITFRAPKGSYAQRYAEANRLPFRPLDQ